MFETEFPRSMDRNKRTRCLALSLSSSYASVLLEEAYMGDQVYSQRVNTVDELKARITEAIANIAKHISQHV
jgi:hypothetical protein